MLIALSAGPGQAAGADRCDPAYAAAQEAHENVQSGLGAARTTPAANRQWRATVHRLLDAIDRVRACYTPLPAPVPNQTAPTSPDEGVLPTPASVKRRRVMQTYDWAVLAYRELRQYDAAFQQYAAFFDRFGGVADSTRIAFMYNSRGYLQYRLGNLTASIDDYSRTIAYTPAADTLGRADRLIDLGTILQKMDDLRAAQQHYAQAERLTRAVSPAAEDRRDRLARVWFNQGDLLVNWPSADDATRSARRQKAIDRLQRVLALYPDGGWSRLPQTHLVLADAHRLTGDLDAAFYHIARGEALAASSGATDFRQLDLRALAGLVRGDAEIAAGRLDAATASLQEALRAAEQANHQDYRLEALSDLGALQERRGRLARAEVHYRRAIAVVNELRASLRATGWAAHTSTLWAEPHRGLVRVLAAQGRHEEAFLALDQSRARHLRDLRMRAQLTRTLPARDRVRFDSLTAALSDVRSTLATETLSDGRRAVLTRKDVRLMAERRRLLRLPPPTALPSVAALQHTLQAQERALVAYYVGEAPAGEPGAPPSSFAFVVTPHAFRFVPLAVDDDTLRTRLGAVSPVLHPDGAPQAAALNATRFDLAALHRLYEDVFAPVAEAVPPALPLTIVPDGPLFRLPFGMLVTQPTQGRAYDRAPYLIRERPLTLELAASLIGDTTRLSPDAPLDIAALGRTDFEVVPTLPPALRARLDTAGALPALPGVQREMEALRTRFAHRAIHLNEDATEERLRTLQTRTKVLHLASHALLHPSDPLANLLVLSPGPTADRTHDGLLFVHELGAQAAPVPLVVLSGCGTARGLLRTGEGPEGLQYAFRSTGAQSTLSTLWDAEDQATVALSSAFYDQLIAGHPKDVALQRAQLELIERFPDRASPFFWAGAVLYGAPQPLTLEPAPLIPLFPVAAGGAILLLIALGFGYARYRRY